MKFEDLAVNDFFIVSSKGSSHKLYFKKSANEIINLTAPNKATFLASPCLWVELIHLNRALTEAVLKDLPK